VDLGRAVEESDDLPGKRRGIGPDGDGRFFLLSKSERGFLFGRALFDRTELRNRHRLHVRGTFERPQPGHEHVLVPRREEGAHENEVGNLLFDRIERPDRRINDDQLRLNLAGHVVQHLRLRGVRLNDEDGAH
jgi:hypothetical protein